jgi:hypothetical protein
VEGPVSIYTWGEVAFGEIEGERIPEETAREIPYRLRDELQEIHRTKPARKGEGQGLRQIRGWWPATRDELQERAKASVPKVDLHFWDRSDAQAAGGGAGSANPGRSPQEHDKSLGRVQGEIRGFATGFPTNDGNASERDVVVEVAVART